MTEQIPEITGGNRNPDGTFKEGVSGNPGGRPPGILSITNLIRTELEKVPELKNKDGVDLNPEKKKWVELFMMRMLQQAIATGDRATQKLIWNYMDGLPKGSLDLTSGGEKITNQNMELANQAIIKFLNGNTENTTNKPEGEDTTTIPV